MQEYVLFERSQRGLTVHKAEKSFLSHTLQDRLKKPPLITPRFFPPENTERELFLFYFFHSDKISASNPRVIEDSRARALCTEMRRCLYYETCATYGLNVDRVFSEGEYLPRMYSE